MVMTARLTQAEHINKRSIRDGRDSRVVFDYEIDTAAIEALNSIEKRAAIETGQEVDRSDINLRGGVAAQAELLRKAFTLDELEVMDAKIEAAKRAPKLIDAPAAEPSEKNGLVLRETHGGLQGVEKPPANASERSVKDSEDGARSDSTDLESWRN